MKKIAIVVSQFNKGIGQKLLEGALRGLHESGIKKSEYGVVEVPGAFEIPFVASRLADEKKYRGIIALGCVLKGETDHYKAVCEGVIYGIQKVSIEKNMPIMFGVLMCKTEKQARERSGSGKKNKGYECAIGLINIFHI